MTVLPEQGLSLDQQSMVDAGRVAVLVTEAGADGQALADLRVLAANPRYATLTGLPIRAVTGRPVRELLARPADAEPLGVAPPQSGGAELGVLRWRREDGRAFRAVVRVYGLHHPDWDDSRLLWSLHLAPTQAAVREPVADQADVLQRLRGCGAVTGVLDVLLRLIEAYSDDALASVRLVGGDGAPRHIAAPRLPDAFSAAVDAAAISPPVPPCRDAACAGHPVAVDIASDPDWASVRDLALQLGLRTCWTVPICSLLDGATLGHLMVYYPSARPPARRDRQMLERCAHIAAVSIERLHARLGLRGRAEPSSHGAGHRRGRGRRDALPPPAGRTAQRSIDSDAVGGRFGAGEERLARVDAERRP